MIEVVEGAVEEGAVEEVAAAVSCCMTLVDLDATALVRISDGECLYIEYKDLNHPQ